MASAPWTTYWIAVAAMALYLYVPGYVFFRGLRYSPAVSAGCAPLYGAFCCAGLPIAYAMVGIPCTILTILGPACALALAAYVLGRLVLKGREDLCPQPLEPVRLGPVKLPFDLLMLTAYVLLGLVVCLVVFHNTLPAPNVVNCQFDNQTHVNTVRSFLDTAQWSTLRKNYYATSAANEQPYPPASGFYPCGWHALTALGCLLSGADVPTAINASVTALASFVFPTSMYLLMRVFFPGERRVVALGAIATSGFSSWPWVFVIKGPRYPNLLGLTLLVAALAVVMLYVEEGEVFKRWLTFALVSVMSLFVLAVAHPNTVFTAYVILVPYGAHVIWKALAQRHRVLAVFALALYLAAVVGFWYFCYQLPIFSSVLSYRWKENVGVLRTFSSLFLLRLSLTHTQVSMCIALALGMVAAVRRRLWWPLFPLAFFALCFVSTRMGWETLKYWLAGMWYQSPDRFAACLSVWAMPLAALGINEYVGWVAGKLSGRTQQPQATGAHFKAVPTAAAQAGGLAVAVAVASFLVITYFPTIPTPIVRDGEPFALETAYGYTIKRLNGKVTQSKVQVYDLDEMAFVDKAVQLVPEGALVLNQPNDGTMYAYGANQLKTFYRSCQGDGRQTDTAKTIRLHLNEYATDKDVQKAVEETGARYLIMLDMGVKYPDEDHLDDFSRWIYQYQSEKAWERWKGINAINDDTPGFEVVLAEGDEMRLYRIVDDAA